MSEIPVLAIIVPCYNEEDVIEKAFFELSFIIQALIKNQRISPQSYICFVDDGSNDKSWEIIIKLSKNKEVKGLKLSRNFGHQAAQLAGLIQNQADIFITIDADLQDDINIIDEMIKKYSEGFEIVYGVRNNRNSDGFIKRILAQSYYRLAKSLGVEGIYNNADFRLISKKIVLIISELKEYNIYLRGIISNLGFKSCCVYYSRKKRIAGIPKYNIFSSLNLAIDGITSFSIQPLHFITLLSFLCFLIAIIMSIYCIVVYFEKEIIPGWASLFISLYFLGGIQLFSIEIIGEYIGKIYKETKQRPKFIVEAQIN
ncbi:MAG: glycosyltransferase family 2 protein [Candidatus Gastranaerophilales bacterium]|nr:glycosyltransferase family 2 protein [Candidatus Gastranaerophilales bacterium]